MKLKIFKPKKILSYSIIVLVSLYYCFRITFNNFPLLKNYYEENIFNNNKHQIDPNSIYTGKKFVVISSTLEYLKDHYMFHLPMTAQSWRRLNFEPIVFVVKPKNETNKLALTVLKYLKLLNINVVEVSTVENYEVIIGMVSRLFVGLSSDYLIKDDDMILTSDTDLFPLNKNYFSFDSSNSIKLWNSDCCDNFSYNNKSYRMYTMLNIGMRKKQWREVMQLDNQNELKIDGESVIKLIRNMFGDWYIQKNNDIKRGSSVWFLDQMTVSIKIHQYVNEENKTNLTKIKFQGTRLNRNTFFNPNWFNQKQLNFLTDFHSFHDDVLQNWKYMQMFLKAIFNESLTKLFDNYYYEYVDIRKKVII